MKRAVSIFMFFCVICCVYANENKFSVFITSSGKNISLGEDISEIRAKLGEPLEDILVKKAGEEPGFYHLKYSFITIGYYETERKVAFIYFTGREVRTSCNITIGNSRFEVLNKYGEAQYSDNEWLLYKTPKKSEKTWLEEVFAIFFCFDKENNVYSITMQD
jgi:hypothetical protein